MKYAGLLNLDYAFVCIFHLFYRVGQEDEGHDDPFGRRGSHFS